MIHLYEIITDVTVVVSIVLAFGVLLIFNTLPRTLKLIGVYLVVGASIDMVASSYSAMRINNLLFLHLFTWFEIIFLSYFFKVVYTSMGNTCKVWPVAIPAICLVVINTFWIQDLDNYNTYSSMLTSLVVLGYSIFFFSLIVHDPITTLTFYFIKWFIITLFLYHSISLMVMLFGFLYTEQISKEAQSSIWIFRALVILSTKVIMAICFIKLFLRQRKLQTQ